MARIVEQILVVLGLKKNEFDAGAKSAKAETSNLVNALKGATSASGLLQTALASAGVMGLASMAKEAGQAAFELAKLGAGAERMETAFTDLASQAGGSADEMLAALQRATEGTVSNAALISSANRGILLGLGANAEQWEDLAEVARYRSRAMGISMTQALNDIVTGLGRESRLILDNLGIIVDVEKVTSDYAATLGTTADKLTETQRKQALLNSVIEDGKAKIEASGGLTKDAADDVEALGAAWANLKEELEKQIAPVVIPIVQEITQVVTGGEADLTGQILAGATDQAGALAGILGTLGVEIEGLPALDYWASVNRDSVQEVASALGVLTSALEGAGFSTEDALAVAERYTATLGEAEATAGMGGDAALNLSNALANQALMQQHVADGTLKASDMMVVLADVAVAEAQSVYDVAMQMATLGSESGSAAGRLRDMIAAMQGGGDTRHKLVSELSVLRAQLADLEAGEAAAGLLGNAAAAAQFAGKAKDTRDRIAEVSKQLRELPYDNIGIAGDRMKKFRDRTEDAGDEVAELGTKLTLLEGVQKLFNLPEFPTMPEPFQFASDYLAGKQRSMWEQFIKDGVDAWLGIEDQAGDSIDSISSDWESSFEDMKSTVAAALQPTSVSALDFMPGREDAWDENARRLDAIAARGGAELVAHPDWASILMIPPDVLAAGDEALKAWAQQTSDDVRNLFRPDLLTGSLDQMVETVRGYVLDQEAREGTIEDVTAAYQAKYGGSAADAKKMAKLLLGDTSQVGETVADDLAAGMKKSMGQGSLTATLVATWKTDVDNNKKDLQDAGGRIWDVLFGGIRQAVKDQDPSLIQVIAEKVAPAVARILSNNWQGGGPT